MAILKKCSIPPDQLETLASDREAWKDVCVEGLAAFDINYDQEAEARRARRHTITSILQHPVLVVISVAESARQNSGSGVIFVLTTRLFPIASTASSSFIDGQQQASKILQVQLAGHPVLVAIHVYCIDLSECGNS